MHKIILSMLFTSLLVGLVLADDSKEVYPFEDVVQEERFLSLLNELRCPKCQGSNLSGSNAPIAIDLKRGIQTCKIRQNGEGSKKLFGRQVWKFYCL